MELLGIDNRTTLKIALAAGLSWWFGNLAGQSRPVFAALTPIVAIKSVRSETERGSVGRVIGVLAGVGIGLGALVFFRPSAVVVACVVAIALGVDRLIRLIPRVGVDTKNQSAISAILMLFVATSVTSYALDRLWETAIGAAVALLIEFSDAGLAKRVARAATT